MRRRAFGVEAFSAERKGKPLCRNRGIDHRRGLRLISVRPLLRFWPDLRSRIGVYILVLVLTLLANGIQLFVPMITGYIIDAPISHRDLSALVLPVLWELGVGIAK